jgi:hypothetical protein
MCLFWGGRKDGEGKKKTERKKKTRRRSKCGCLPDGSLPDTTPELPDKSTYSFCHIKEWLTTPHPAFIVKDILLPPVATNNFISEAAQCRSTVVFNDSDLPVCGREGVASIPEWPSEAVP